MESYGCTSEIVESKDVVDSSLESFGVSKSFDFRLFFGERDGKSPCHSVGGNLIQIIEEMDRGKPLRSLSPLQVGSNLPPKGLLKKPEAVGVCQTSGIGISESATLKQALRRLCISQASEMAATKKLMRRTSVTGPSESAATKKLHASTVVQARENDSCLQEMNGTTIEISVVPEITNMTTSHKTASSERAGAGELPTRNNVPPPRGPKTKIKDIIAPASSEIGGSLLAAEETGTKVKRKLKSPLSAARSLPRSRKPMIAPRLVQPAIRNKTGSRRRIKQEPSSAFHTPGRSGGDSKGTIVQNKNKFSGWKESFPSSAHSKANLNYTTSRKNKDGVGSNKPDLNKVSTGSKKTDTTDEKISGAVGIKLFDGSISREKGECSQSSKSSIGDYSCSTSISDDSHLSSFSGNGCKPHMSSDVRWSAIRQFVLQHGSMGLRNFKLIKKLGCGDIGTVYLAELIGSGCLFALKVMDIEFLISRKKMLRAQTEKEILGMLDHPFLPTLYAHFTTDHLACLAMEYCPGGDLHILRQKQPGRCFAEPEARFYVAEVLLALEYLHMLGVIYRDLKPENILVGEDGHIMLSDFDLSLRCSVNPTLIGSASLGAKGSVRKSSGTCSENSCIEPFCLQPSWVPGSCFTPRLSSASAAAVSVKSTSASCGGGSSVRFPLLVVEPTDLRSNSFVGTHEYLAPEIIRGDGHGAAVDWWTLGIFLYELLYGRTPFKGCGNEETLANVVSQGLRFPEAPAISVHARDLIKALLSKDPESRLGYFRGAAELKLHPFFEGLNWALIRCAAPPEVPRVFDSTPTSTPRKKEGKCLDFRANGENTEFELF